MLSTKALHIMEQLEQKNGQTVTAKELAAFCGMSERSVKTYINEVEEFCRVTGGILLRKPGKGFVYQGSKVAENQMEKEKFLQMELNSRKYRISYMVYILLMGWSTYTIALFAEELSVSRNTITQDLESMGLDFSKFGLKIRKVAGKGIVLEGDEFTKRKAFRHFCRCAIEKVDLDKVSDERLSLEDEKRCVANYGKSGFYFVLKIIKNAEKNAGIWYTDYSFKMIVEYMAIQFMRINQGKYLEDIIDNEQEESGMIEAFVQQEFIKYPKQEQNYLNKLLMSGEYQDASFAVIPYEHFLKKVKISDICEDVSQYISEILNVELVDTSVFRQNLKHFLPASFLRAKYGFEVENPFLQDVKETYPGIFTVSFSLARYYKKYVDVLPNEQELSFLALFLGGAIMFGKKHIKAVVISSCGTYIASIVASRLEEKMSGLKVIGVISSQNMEHLEYMDYDILLGLQSDILSDKYDILPISSFITEQDIQNINRICFDRISTITKAKYSLLKVLLPNQLMVFQKEKISKEELIHIMCEKMQKANYVSELFEQSVYERERICSTSLGKGIAIPHGTSNFVVKPGISIVCLKHPIDWGGEEVDLVFFFALNFENITMTRDFFHEFIEFTESKEQLKQIRSADSQETLEEIMESILHGQ